METMTKRLQLLKPRNSRDKEKSRKNNFLVILAFYVHALMTENWVRSMPAIADVR
jgi:hypothetical protein